MLTGYLWQRMAGGFERTFTHPDDQCVGIIEAGWGRPEHRCRRKPRFFVGGLVLCGVHFEGIADAFASEVERQWVEHADEVAERRLNRAGTNRSIGVVYFAVREPSIPGDWRHGLVKIGITTKLDQRMAVLEARALASVRGSRRRERRYHELCRAQRVRGEWFQPEGPVLDLLERHGGPGCADAWLVTLRKEAA